MEKIIEIQPPFDKRNSDPNKNYGIHGLQFKYIIKGKHGSVQWMCYTGLHLDHVRKELSVKGYDNYSFMAAELGYHANEPRYEGQQKMECCYTGKGFCYYDGSTLNAERLLPIFLNEGSEGIWSELENYYKEIFNFEE